ncbi:MAG: sodium:alanine symporter family protein [Waddliaceae bacterium]|nr:sodium:alanine symporter family protein [Waddliaceae bacterium]
MDTLHQFLLVLRDWVWSPPFLFLIVGTGIYLTIAFRGVQFRYLFYGLRLLFFPRNDCKHTKGDLSQFRALMTALAGSVGTGSIAGVSTAVITGGLGALFWMWVTGLLGMATKFAEATLAVKYRESDLDGNMCGGPMYYIEKGLNSRFLGGFFALATAGAVLSTGNMVQVNSIAQAAYSLCELPHIWTGVICALMTALVILGGVQGIGRVAGVLVPFMAFIYLGGGVLVLFLNYTQIPQALSLIVKSAFTGQAAFGGFAGSTIMLAIQMGVSRGIFSNEAGLGSSAIADASARVDVPGRQAVVSMVGTFLSTIVICTITGLVLAITGVVGTTTPDGTLVNGVPLAMEAFESAFFGGQFIVTIGLIFFAYSTLLAWAYYGERSIAYLFGVRYIPVYRVLYIAVILPASVMQLGMVWALADVLNAFMAAPNLFALIMLAPVVRKELKAFSQQVDREEELSLVSQD